MSICTVARVNGQSPEAWQRDHTRVYVGRYVFLRSGKNVGQAWPASGFGNPYRFQDQMTRSERIEVLFEYACWLHGSMRRSATLRQLFESLQGKTLGCWCVDWDGISSPAPLCHAVWLARIVNAYFAPGSHGACVLEDGLIVSLTFDDAAHFDELDDTEETVTFRRVVR